MREPLQPDIDAWQLEPRPPFVGGNSVRLLQGGDELFPAMCQAMAGAQHEIWLATYIFQDDAAGRAVADALLAAAQRGVAVRVVLDGFGSKDTLRKLRQWLAHDSIDLVVFRPIDRWWAWFQPGQLRRLHQKLCAVDGEIAFVGGINVIDDRFDQNHGVCDTPRLDFAVELRGPVAQPVGHTAHAMWARATLGSSWRHEVRALARSARPVRSTLRLLRELSINPEPAVLDAALLPVPVGFVVRDNLRQRRAIEHVYIAAIRKAQHRVEIICPYFYPGRAFRRVLRQAADRGVQVRLLLQGKVDYRFAGLAARVLYEELLAHGVRIFEYTPAFLHAKVAVVDDDWATVGSSNIDPLSLLLNLEANAVINDPAFAAELRQRFDDCAAVSREVTAPPVARGWRRWASRGFVAWTANLYLRLAGAAGRY